MKSPAKPLRNMLEMTMREDIAWAAGLFEGEGSFMVAYAPSYPRAVVIMTDEDVIRRFGAVVGLGNIRGPYTRKGQPANKWKPFWTWSVSGFEKTQAIYAMFWPWLGARRRQRGKELLSAHVPRRHRNHH
jgi:hypothetical protein